MTKIASLKIAYGHKIRRTKRIVSLSKRQETVHVRDRRVVIGINSNASPRRREQDDESADTDVGVDDISEDAVGEMSEEIATECRADGHAANAIEVVEAHGGGHEAYVLLRWAQQISVILLLCYSVLYDICFLCLSVCIPTAILSYMIYVFYVFLSVYQLLLCLI